MALKSMQFASSTCVPILLRSGSPSAIIRFIVAIVVVTFNGQTDRSLPHIGKKISKIKPSRANLYSSASVVLKSFVFWVIATAHHTTPRYPGSLLGSPIFKPSIRCRAAASTGSRASRCQTLVQNNTGFTALAKAITHAVGLSAWSNAIRSFRNYFELSEGTTYEAYFGRHFNGSFIGCLASNGRLATAIGAVLILPPFLGSYKEIQ